MILDWENALVTSIVFKDVIYKLFKEPLPLRREKEMATHSSILAWRIPWMEELGGLQSTGSQRVGHDFTFTFTHLPLRKQHRKTK